MVQPHLKKLFDNIVKVKLQKGSISGKFEVYGMFSADGEYIEFSNVVYCEGPVERWLCDIEAMMRVTLHNEIKVTRSALRKMFSKRDKWIKGDLVFFFYTKIQKNFSLRPAEYFFRAAWAAMHYF